MTHAPLDPRVKFDKPEGHSTQRKDPQDSMFQTMDCVRVRFDSHEQAVEFAKRLSDERALDPDEVSTIRQGDTGYLKDGDRFKVIENPAADCAACVDVFGNWTELAESTLRWLDQNAKLNTNG